MSEFLDQPLGRVIGGKSATALGDALSLRTVGELLRHYPRRYAEQGSLTGLAALQEGANVTVVAEIAEVTSRRMRNRKGSILDVRLTDGQDSVRVTFFNQAWRERELRVGRSGLFSGTISSFRGTRQLAHPRYLLFPDGVQDDPEAAEAFASRLIPVYPAGGRVTTWEIARAMRVVLDTMPEDLEDPLPAHVRSERNLPDLRSSLLGIHRPATLDEARGARARLTFEEALVLQVEVVRRRESLSRMSALPRVGSTAGLRAAFDGTLPFNLTAGQIAVGEEVAADLARSRPMQRLLQGDVGSGKTVVAVRAMLDVVDSGGQAALVAPTEVLAVQHARTIRAMLGPLAESGTLETGDLAALGTQVVLVTGSLRGKEREAVLAQIATGAAGIIVGTHALFEETVRFHDLGLVVIDEQHRFGVEQRARLSERQQEGTRPHMLVMTATPIPRTVVMTVFGDLEVSTLLEVPAGRADVATHVVHPGQQPRHVERIWDRVAEEVVAGHRVFVVCPRIGDGLDATSDEATSIEGEPTSRGVMEFSEWLRDRLPGARVGIMHGRMTPDEKDGIMNRFRSTSDDAIDVLVSTTVIEVGVDVPQATMMVIMNAERFGVSQLHQLRGRIGRGELPGVCIFVSDAEGLSRERLDAVAATRDGFLLAQHDVEFRGAGDVLGVAQSGVNSSLRLLDVVRDVDLIHEARVIAEELVVDDPTMARWPALHRALVRADEERMAYLERV